MGGGAEGAAVVGVGDFPELRVGIAGVDDLRMTGWNVAIDRAVNHQREQNFVTTEDTEGTEETSPRFECGGLVISVLALGSASLRLAGRPKAAVPTWAFPTCGVPTCFLPRARAKSKAGRTGVSALQVLAMRHSRLLD